MKLNHTMAPPVVAIRAVAIKVVVAAVSRVVRVVATMVAVAAATKVVAVAKALVAKAKVASLPKILVLLRGSTTGHTSSRPAKSCPRTHRCAGTTLSASTLMALVTASTALIAPFAAKTRTSR